ncbi:MAG TPA: hypothetical protein VEJ63_00460 [Planctomycetota bacterium]|nr:hypothetical protein [Planctomycetota bacterium]
MRHLTCAFAVAGCLLLSGCTTTAAKRALNKPAAKDKFSGFDADAADASKREAPRPEKLNPDSDPEVAVTKLVDQLQKDRAHAVYAEEQLRYWGSKQGVDKIVVSKVRLLLKNEAIEVRAPALRLTMQFGGNEVNGDLVECLADPEYGIRATAYKALKARTGLDFGFSPAGGEVARAKAVQEWRQWWQAEQRRLAVKDPSIYELKPIAEPRVERVGDETAAEKSPKRREKEVAEPEEEAPKRREKTVAEDRKPGRKTYKRTDADAPDEDDADFEESNSDDGGSRLLLKNEE